MVGVVGYECKIDEGSVAACPSPTTYGGLAQGSHTFTVSAMDSAGNLDQTPDVYTWAIDTTAPVVFVANTAVDATTAAGAPVSFTASATDTNPTGPAVTCTRTSGSTFSIGTTEVVCSATDAAGNTGTARFTVTVRGAGPQLTALLATVQTLASRDTTTRKNLQSILESAQKAMNKGDVPTTCATLTAFANKVHAQSGKKITVAVADGLIIDDRRIMTVLGCSRWQENRS